MSVPEKLQEFFKEHPKLALGFSGGVDSSYLLYAAKASGADVQPYFIKSQFQPQFELDDALKLSQQLGVELQVIELDLTPHEHILSNPSDRCYHCKRLVFEEIIKQATKDGYNVFIDGNNASDDDRDRPGMKAVQELKVVSPLREAGLTKDDVRELSFEADLFTWNKPSYACLATRIPTGHAITEEELKKVEEAEDRLFELGFYDYRIRVMDQTAKIQLPLDQMARALELRETILEVLTPYFSDVVLDLKAR